mgnify:CR=1 FL=1
MIALCVFFNHKFAIYEKQFILSVQFILIAVDQLYSM